MPRKPTPLGPKPTTPEPSKENWLRRNSYWFWPCVTIAIAFTTWVTGGIGHIIDTELDRRIESRMAAPLNDIKALQIDAAKIGAKLDTFIDLEKLRLKSLANLKDPAFQHALPEVADALSDAARLKITVPLETVNSIRQRLVSSTKDLPGYWTAAAAMITYRSEGSPSSLPQCLDHKPVSKYPPAEPGAL